MVGKTLGHYEILEPLGAGGMGEVYRARDTKLDRDVAIKVLPEDFATDPDRLARFEREAKLLASLNHANIAAIYGLEDEGDQRFIVMEVVEGETLAERIARSGRIEVEEALEIARQIAEALEAAHENGVIHRDLKPANVIVTPEGKVKVLDFGLAKAYEADGSSSGISPDLSASPTMAAATRTGVIMGTAAYMSPEQARGKPVDKRTDIWAFGCLLYETLAGNQPFGGETTSDISAAILTAQPDWDALPATAPVKLRALVRRCLRKNRDERVHDIADARIEIGEILSEPDGALGFAGAAVILPIRARWQLALPWGLAAVLAALAFWAMWDRRSSSADVAPPDVARFQITTEPLMSTARATTIAISADGRRIVYSAMSNSSSRLFRRDLEALFAEPIAGTENAVGPFLSPDARRVGFAADGQLQVVSLEGGPPTPLHKLWVFLGGSWGPDDAIVFGEWPSRSLWRIPAGGGDAEAVTDPSADVDDYLDAAPQYLPGLEAVFYNSVNSFTPGGSSLLRVKSFATGDERRLELAGSTAHYVDTGHLVFGHDGTLYAVPFDAHAFRPKGSPVAVLEGVLTNRTGTVQFDISETGTLVYVPGLTERVSHRLVWVDREGNATPVVTDVRQFWGPRFSPDGTRLAMWIAGENPDVWIYDLARETLAPLTSEGTNFWPVWTPDGEFIAFVSREPEGFNNISWQKADRSAPIEQVLAFGDLVAQPIGWTAGRELFIFQQMNASDERGFEQWTIAADGSAQPRPFHDTPANELHAALSPEGEWLAYVSDESGRREVYVKPFPAGGSTNPISNGGGTEPIWSRDGRQLFYRGDGVVMAVDIATSPSFRASRPRPLFEDRFIRGTPYGKNWDAAPDGDGFVMVESATEPDAVTTINVVVNWFEELKQRVPTGGSQ